MFDRFTIFEQNIHAKKECTTKINLFFLLMHLVDTSQVCFQSSEEVIQPCRSPADVLVGLIRMNRLVDLLCTGSGVGTNEEYTAGQAVVINPISLSRAIGIKQIRAVLRGEKIYCNTLFMAAACISPPDLTLLQLS